MLISDKLDIAKDALEQSMQIFAVWSIRKQNAEAEVVTCDAMLAVIRNDQVIMQERIDALERELDLQRQEQP